MMINYKCKCLSPNGEIVKNNLIDVAMCARIDRNYNNLKFCMLLIDIAQILVSEFL